MDRTLQYWYLLRDLGISVHTANSGEVDLSVAAMLYLNYSLKDIQTWLGHSNYNFTADTYIHSGAGVHEQMAQSLSERLGEVLPQTLLAGSNFS